MSAFSDFMDELPAGTIGLAVSGGSDSVALLALAADWARDCDRVIKVASVDHGLRKEAAAEAAGVAMLCDRLGVEHTTLRWDGQHQGNTQDAARRARQRLIGDWAKAEKLAAVATGHTRDDQAETFLLRLKRGSGVDGLAGMAERVRKDGVLWVRPLLTQRRDALRDVLRQRGIKWVDDPSNEDTIYDRVKMRKALVLLDEFGLDVDVFASTAERLQMARGALEQVTLAAAHRIAEPRPIGSVRLNVEALKVEPEEVQLRLLAHALGWVSGARYRPRLQSLKAALAAVLAGRGHSLGGCLILSCKDGCVEVCREVVAMGAFDVATGRFDGRWTCDPEKGDWRPLGEVGLQQFPDWRDTAERRETLISSPSLWYNNELKSAPFVDKPSACKCLLHDGPESFFASFLSH